MGISKTEKVRIQKGKIKKKKMHKNCFNQIKIPLDTKE